MTIVWRNVHEEITRAKVERAAAMRIGAAFAASLGVEKAVKFCAREKILVKAGGEATNAAGSFLVPDEVEDAIDAFRNLAGVIRREAGTRAMGSDTRAFPRRLTAAAANFVAENQPATETSVSFDTITLRAKKALAFLRGSSEMLEDSLASTGEWLVEELGAALSQLEDNCGWLGDGSPLYAGMTGICTKLTDGLHAGAAQAASGHDAVSKIDAGDVETLQALLPEQSLPGAKFYGSRAGVSALVRLGAKSFGAAVTPYGVRPLLQYGGYEVVPAPQLAGAGTQTGKCMLAFGDLRAAVTFGERRGIRIATSSQRYIEADQIAFKASARFEIVASNLGDATTAGALVGLLGA